MFSIIQIFPPSGHMRNKLIPASLVIVTLVLALFGARYHRQAFPELSPSFLVKKSEIPRLADQLAIDFALNPKEYQRAVTFGEDTRAKYFLELEYGLNRLRQAVGNGVNIWQWSVRYFRAGQKEEFTLGLDTEGRLVSYSHLIPETAALPKINREQALKLAENFLAGHVTRHPLSSLRLIETGAQERVGHHVYRFTWERTDWHWGDGRYLLNVVVLGNTIGGYGEHLETPEAWERDFSRKRSTNAIFQAFASAAATLLGLGFLIMFLLMAVRHQVRWHGFPFLWVLPVGVVLLIAEFSQFPEIMAGYATTDNFNSYIVRNVIHSGYITLLTLLEFGMLAFMADTFWQKSFPGSTPIRSLLNGRGLATKESVRAVGLGFFLAVLSFSYVTAYYLLGRKIGFWSPSSIDQARVLTSYFPAVEALSIGISAAWAEEFIFRVLGLVFIYRLSGSKWLAIVSTALIWGFLHSSYPQMPGYARGVELTLEGILLGWFATRYGILVTFLSHCLFNTWLGAIIAWQTGSFWHMAMAVAVSTWPVLLWAKGWYESHRRGGYMQPTDLVSGSPHLDQQLQEAKAIISVTDRPLPGKWWVVGAIVLVAAGMFFLLQPAKPLADLGHVLITRNEAIHQADGFLRQKTGLDPASFFSMADHYAYMSGDDTEYLLEHADPATVAENMRRYLYQDYWKVNYFKPEQRDRYTVYLNPDGSPFLLSRSVADTEPGAKLNEKQAIRLASDFLVSYLQGTADQVRYVSHDMQQQKDRLDYNITFENTSWHIGESHLRWTVAVLGGTVNDVSTFLKLPESYLREKEKRGWLDVIKDLLGDITDTALLVGFLVVFVILLVRHHINWRLSLLFGFLMLFCDALLLANDFPDFFEGYRTTQSLANYFGGRVVSLLSRLALSYLKGVALFAMLLGMIRWLTGKNGRAVLLPDTFPEIRRRWLRGIMIGLAGAVLLWLLDQLAAAISLMFSGEALLEWSTVSIQGYSPGTAVILAAVKSALTSGLGAGIIMLVVVLFWKKHRNLLIFFLMLMVLDDAMSEWRDALAGIHGMIFQIAGMGLKIWIFVVLCRFNPFAYFFMFYYLSILPATVLMSEKAWPVYAWDAILIWCAAVLPLLIALMAPRFSHILGNGAGSGPGCCVSADRQTG